MGRIKHVLENRTVGEAILNRRFTVELCENVHLHYRNLRLEFPKEEFLTLLRHLKQLDESKIESFDYGHGKFQLIAEDQKLPEKTEFNHRVQIEEQVEGHYHVHFRNLRVELRDLADLGVRPPLRTYPVYLLGKYTGLARKAKQRLRRAVGRRVREWSVSLRPWKWRRQDPRSGVAIDTDFYSRYILKNSRVRSIQPKSVKLSNLRAHIRTPAGDNFIAVGDTPAARYLVGDKPGYEAYHKLENAFDVHDAKRFDDLIQSVRTTGYDPKKSAIVVFNGEPVIRDGQHRAAILYHLHGDIEVTVANVEFA